MTSVLLVTEAFEAIARSQAKGRGCADIPIIVLPHPVGHLTLEQLAPIVATVAPLVADLYRRSSA